jgi:ribosome-associated toxin RatA of RatAB toxin-antitoxin module
VDEDVTERRKKKVIKVSLERGPFDYLEEMISTTLTDVASTLDLPFEFSQILRFLS